jgi:uncharacterized protein
MEPQDLRAALERREQRRRVELSLRRDHLRKSAVELARLLIERGATKVVLFGSLVSGDTHEASDIDLAVEGLPPDVYFDTLGALLMASPCGVDLVRLEEAPESLRRVIEATGVELDGH